MKLNVTVTKNDTVDLNRVKEALKKQVAQNIENRLTGICAERSEIAAVIERQGDDSHAYRIKLRMHIPPKMIFVSEGRDQAPETAIEKAVNTLLEKMTDHTDRMRLQESHKRRSRLSRIKSYRADQENLRYADVNEANVIIGKLLPRLKNAVKRELAFLQSQGDLPPDYPTLQDVVDEVVAAVIADWKPGMDSREAYLCLLKGMHGVLDKEVQASRVFGDMISLDEPAQPDPVSQSGDMADETFYEFWQPDEMLRIEDTIAADMHVLDEPEAKDDQKSGYTLRLLKDLPISWRRALILHKFENMTKQDLTRVLSTDMATVTARISHAQRYIRARLKEAGFDTNGT